MTTDKNHWREKRHELLLRFIAGIPKPATLLDVGGTVQYWMGLIPEGWELTIINVIDQTPADGETVIIGSGCNLPFKDQSFDLVFSNSAIAFCGGYDAQKAFAGEIQRVGKRYFVQTPNQHFPIDWRTLTVAFHWLSPEHQAWVQSKTRVGRYPKAVDYADALAQATRVRDLNRGEVKVLFPGGEIFNERAFGLTKSFIVYK